MPHLLRCSQGHEWETAGAATCPVCGQTAQTITSHDWPTMPPPVVSPAEPLPNLRAYEVLGEVGRGGMGIVYKARLRDGGQLVALKIIRKDRTQPEALERFRREARAAARLSHPNIVQLYEAGREGDVYFLAMEFVDGVTLEHVVERQGRLALELACDYLRQAALALQHAHERKMIHRDVKPSNLMVAGNLLKILDMGVARLHQLQSAAEETITTLTQHGAVLGTPDFIAPEQVANPHAVDVRADLYSLGCTAFYLLTGKAPFDGGTIIEKLDRQRWEVPPSVDQLRPDAPPALAAVVRRLLAKKPDDRFQTPADLADALDELARTGHVERLRRAAALTPAGRITAHPGGVTCLAFLADGKHVVSAGRDRSLRVWSVPDGKEVRRQELPREATALAAVPGGAGILVAAGVTVRLLDALTGEERQRYAGHLGAVRALAVSADGVWVGSGGDDKTVRLWDAASGRAVQKLAKHADAVTGVAFAPDGKALASAGRDQRLLLWEVPAGRLGREFVVPRGGVTGVAFAADGQRLASAHFDTTLRLWDRETGRELRRLRGHRQMVTAVAWQGETLASCGNDRMLRLWDADSGAENAHGEGHAAAVASLAVAQGGRTLATGDADGVVCLWAL